MSAELAASQSSSSLRVVHGRVFSGDDYFCESGTNSVSGSGFHPYDPLWDGEGCTSSSTCCSFNNPPYFTKQIFNPTTEARLCWWEGGEETPIEFIDLYVK